METKEKKKEGLSRLFEIAGQKKGLLFLAGLLSAGSAVCMLVPYWAVYEVLKELLTHGTSPASVDEAGMIRWGWIAFCGLIGGLVLLYAALMSSHVAAFRILYGLRVRLSEHIGKLSLGYLNNTSTGAIKKTMEQNIEKIEGFIAHTIPDLVNVVATVVVMLVIFFSLDTWLTAVCLAVVLLSFALQFSNFMGKKAREFMSIYYDAQEKMSASAVQYVRGMPVVKIFGQSVRSFRQFNAEIQAYKTFALKCCDTLYVRFITGLSGNPALMKKIDKQLRRAKGDFELHHEDVRRYYSFEYKAKSWKYRQRVIAKIEVSDKGVNVRFIVTSNRNNKPETVYRRYCKRGTMELWIKDLKYFRADRMSCSSFRANMFRLFLYGAAYVTAYRLRSKAFSNTEVGAFTMDSFMKRIMLSAVFIVEKKTFIRFSFSPHHRHLEALSQALTRLSA